MCNLLSANGKTIYVDNLGIIFVAMCMCKKSLVPGIQFLGKGMYESIRNSIPSSNYIIVSSVKVRGLI